MYSGGTHRALPIFLACSAGLQCQIVAKQTAKQTARQNAQHCMLAFLEAAVRQHCDNAMQLIMHWQEVTRNADASRSTDALLTEQSLICTVLKTVTEVTLFDWPVLLAI